MGVPACPPSQSLRRLANPKSAARLVKSSARASARPEIENGELAGIRFDEAREETAEAYVFAVPHTALAELLPESMKQGDPSLPIWTKSKSHPHRSPLLVRPRGHAGAFRDAP